MTKFAAPEAVRAQVLVVSGSVGAGHDGAADELIDRLAALGVPTERRDFLDAVPWPARLVLREGYSVSIGHAPWFFDWLFASLERNGWVQRLTLGLCWVARFRMLRWSLGRRVVVSTYPLASQTLGMLRGTGALDAVVVTYLTDPAVHRMWVHPDVDHHLTVTEATSRMGRLAYRTPMRAVGGLVSPRFGDPLAAEYRGALRAELGLSGDRPVVLIAAGSLGLGEVDRAVREIAATGVGNLLVLCGRSTRLRERLADQDGVIALGWRDDVPELMALSDVLVHNAGGLTVTEALTAGLPAVTFRPIPGHGTANATTLAEAGLAQWPAELAELVELIRGYATLRADRNAVVREPDAVAVVAGLLADAGYRTGDDYAQRRFRQRWRRSA
jgi:UDP-N-acetylglucosamine:LPS N-acetylglucosamine transferase